MPDANILLILPDLKTCELLDRSALTPLGYQVSSAVDWQTAESLLQSDSPDLIIISDVLEGRDTSELIDHYLTRYPPIPVILIPTKHSDNLAIDALRRGFSDYLQPPVRTTDLQEAVARSLAHQNWLSNWVRLESKRDSKSLRERVNGMETIQRIGRQVTSTLELDGVLAEVVDAAVALTKAEEGSLLLLDEDTGELYMRASKNFQEDFASTFRLAVQDSLAGQVLRTGKPVVIDEKKPQKIKTAYLVQAIIYVPLVIHGRIIGVLEVDNRHSSKPFTDYHLTLVSALADYAAIAIENANLYSKSEIERNKLETVLKKIEDAVIIIDHDYRIILVNRRAREAFNITDNHLTGKRAREVIHHQEMLESIRFADKPNPSRVEITLDDGRILNAQITPIPEIGVVVNMQDITHLKELDRIKSEFVSTVSHDLRSPLTAILGYVELIDRVGSINEQQKDFIQRVQFSVNGITALIDDLLDLGRIEAGFDSRNEIIPFSAIISYAVDGLQPLADDKSQQVVLDIPSRLPHVLGNPIRLRQMLSNLIANSIKYTQSGGKITISARSEGDQIITQVSDNGPGIPPPDQPYIFDKFYRASNASSGEMGTGLGLAIVKSIAENHLGRVWVESSLGEGTTFSIVLPITNRDL